MIFCPTNFPESPKYCPKQRTLSHKPYPKCCPE